MALDVQHPTRFGWRSLAFHLLHQRHEAVGVKSGAVERVPVSTQHFFHFQNLERGTTGGR